MSINRQKRWWIVPAAAGAVGLVVLLAARLFLPNLASYALLLLLLLVGLSFLWTFIKRDVWWAIAPAVGAFAGVMAVVVNLFLPEHNGWIDTLILGAGAFVVAAIPNRRVEINVAHFVGIVIIVVGFLISPMRTVWKIVFVVASILLAAYFAWLDREDIRRLFAS